MPDQLKTDLFKKKQELIKVRIPGFLMWRTCIEDAIRLLQDFPFSADSEIQREIDAGSAEEPSRGILDYASASDMSPLEAFNYLKLYVDERSTKRIVLHAIAEKFARQINGCTNTQEVDMVCSTMSKEILGFA